MFALYLSLYKMIRPMFDENGLFRASNVYQHVCMYLGFTMSGLVDFLGMYVPLPEGSEQVNFCFFEDKNRFSQGIPHVPVQFSW